MFIVVAMAASGLAFFSTMLNSTPLGILAGVLLYISYDMMKEDM